jgi:membrane protease YdiL (CAAX protease family)
VVLGVFPLSAVLTAVIVLLRHSLGLPVGAGHAPQTLGNRPAVNVLIDSLETLTEFVPAVLAAYLLTRSGGGLRAIGVDRLRIAADLAPTAKLFAAAYVLPIVVVTPLLSLVHHGDINPSDPPPGQAIYLIPLVLTSLAAGVVEEIVVLGFFTHRLEQRGWGGVPLVGVLVALRLSYHLYYGVGVLTLLPWAVLSVIMYRRRRRLLPFIVAHVLWDTLSFSESYLHGAGFALLLLGVAILLLVLFLVGRQQLQVPVLVMGVDGVAQVPAPPGSSGGVPESVGPQGWLGAGGAASTANSTPSG